LNTKFLTLLLNCQREQVLIEFSPQITFFHGSIGAGKSSIARLVDFCLGSDLEKTPALRQELVSVILTAEINNKRVTFEREANNSNQVQVSWEDQDKNYFSFLAPLSQTRETPVLLGNDVYTLSDLIFFLLGLSPIKVRRSKREQESELVRLSFRDIMWYCYLQQDHIDSSFYHLINESFKTLKSRDVMRFIFGYYTEKLNTLELQLDELREEQRIKIETSKQVQGFLQQFGFDSGEALRLELVTTQHDLEIAQSELQQFRDGFTSDTHFVDELRTNLRDLSNRLDEAQKILNDLETRISEQEALKAELVSAKFKLARAETSLTILTGALFDVCPACGMAIDKQKQRNDGECILCSDHIPATPAQSIINATASLNDLNSRIDELVVSIARQKIALDKQQRFVSSIVAEKRTLDNRLAEEIKNYDSIFLASSREAERRIATLTEKIRNLAGISEMPDAIVRLQREANDLNIQITETRNEIEQEKGKLTNSVNLVGKLETSFLEALLAIKFPGVEPDDKVEINTKTWIPSILPNGDPALKWGFEGAGSGGKKTLLNVCYALALHKIATENKLPLPTFLIIDTPMKNVAKEANIELFIAFYNYLYELAATSLSETQFIIVDQEYVAPVEGTIDVRHRLMTPSDNENPPLIPYYRGP